LKPIIQASNLRACYVSRSVYGKKEFVQAVDDVNLSINENEIFGIAGESGCGKSTLIRVLYKLVTPPLTVTSGKVIFDPEGEKIDIFSLEEKTLRTMRWKKFSYIPQGSMSVLNPTMRIKNQFLEVIKAHQKDMKRKEAEKLIEENIEELGLPIEVLTSYPHQLSGGMKQRIIISLSALLKPGVIFADEPTTALDVITQRGVMQMLQRIQKKLQNSVVLVTHDMGVQAEFTNRVAIFYAGKIVETAPTERIFEAPRHPYTRYLIGALPRIGDKTRRVSLGGLPPSLKNPPEGCRFQPRCPLAEDKCKKQEPPMVEIGSDHYLACHKL